MKNPKLLSLLLGALFVLSLSLTGCGEEVVITPNPIPEETGKGDTPWDKETTTANLDVAPYFSEGDIEYFEITQLTNPSFIDPYKEEITTLYSEYRGLPASVPASGLSWEIDIAPYFQWYAVGTITADNEYKDQTLIVLKSVCEGMCFEMDYFRFAWDEETNELTWFPNHSRQGETAAYLAPLFANKDETLTLNGLDAPTEITLPDGVNKITLATDSYDYFPNTVSNPIAFEDDTMGKIYLAYSETVGPACLLMNLPDGSVAQYEYNPGLNFDLGKESPGDVTITWDDGSTTNLTQNYKYRPTGCGIINNCYMIEDVNEANLTVAGKTSNGLDIYEVSGLANLDSANTTDLTLTAEQTAFMEEYNSYVDMQIAWETTPKTYAEYLALHPKLYFKDPLGRFGALMQIEIVPPAECGKPVIYLYPTKTTTVSVKVGIDQITYSDPAYGNNGWKVVAQPDGTLTNLADGMTYPYLFWEGLSNTGVSPASGFMVAREEIESFLNDSLTQLGLTTQEKADFMEYWVSRMLNFDEPYFYITFVGTQDFNKVAPLDITPKPDTLIRVFMYFDPVNTPFQVKEQTLSSVQRRGFTVVEWGGTASRPWKK